MFTAKMTFVVVATLGLTGAQAFAVDVHNQVREINDKADASYDVNTNGTLKGTVENPKGKLELTINGQSTVELKGNVKTLALRLIDGQCPKVDLSKLVAETVEVAEKIDGQCKKVMINGRTVKLKDVSGQSIVWVTGAAEISGHLRERSQVFYNDGANIQKLTAGPGCMISVIRKP